MKSTSLCVVVLLLGGCGMASTKPSVEATGNAASSPVNSASEPVSQTDDGVRLSIVSYDEILERIAANRGKVVVMDAWSTSCQPCIKEFHNLVELHKKYGPDKLACMSLSFDYEGLGKPEEQVDTVLGFLRSQGATFENLMSNEESDALYRKFKLAAIPAVFVYDRTGELRKRFDNQKAMSPAEQFTYEQVGQLVAELLKEDSATGEAATGQLPTE